MILVASGRHRIYPWIALGGLLFNIVVNIVLIPRMSFNGAAVATVSTELLLFVAIWIVVRQSLPVHRMFPMLPLGAAVALCAVVTVAGTICVERLGVPWPVVSVLAPLGTVGIYALVSLAGGKSPLAMVKPDREVK
jgi:O-antigen/teichoic acid export membrane protein